MNTKCTPEWKAKALELLTAEEVATEESRILKAESAGREQAAYEQANGHTEPRSFEKDGDPHAGAYSHLSAAGYSKLGARMYALPFIDAYKAAFTKEEA